MVDTQRSRAELLAIFADNTDESIGAQQERDLIASVFGGYGGLYLQGGAFAQSLGVAPAKLTGTAGGWTGAFASSGTTPSAVGSTVSVAVAGVYLVAFSATVLLAAARDFLFQAYGGPAGATPLPGVRSEANEADAASTHRVVGIGLAVLAAGDVVALFGSCATPASNATLVEAQLVVKRIG